MCMVCGCTFAKQEMFQVAGCFLSYKSVYRFLMMMEFSWNINLFSINLYIEFENDKEEGNVPRGWKLSLHRKV